MSPVVGRGPELDRLRGFLGAPGPSSCFVLSGEPGIGKTTLWEAGLELADGLGYRVLSTRGNEAEADLSFAALVDLLESVDDHEVAAVPAPQRRAIDVALRRSEPTGGPPDPLAIATGFLNVLRGMLASAPLLIGIDDVQWLDAASLSPLQFAARRLAGERARYLLTRRLRDRSPLEEVLLRRGVEAAEIDGLSMGALGRVLSDRLGMTLSRRALRRVHERSHGNPLFALEVGRSIGLGGNADGTTDLPLPEAAANVFATRVGNVDAGVRRVLLALALTGELSRSELSSFAHPLVVEDAVASGLIVVDRSRARVTHPMLADAARGMATASERQSLHLELSSVLADPTLRVRHLVLGTAAPDEELATLAAGTAEQARNQGRVPEAIDLAEHALRLTAQGDDARSERTLALARLHVTAGHHKAAVDLLESQLGSLLPGRPRGLGYCLLAEVTDPAVATIHLDHALAQAPDDADLQGRVYSSRALLSALAGVAQLVESQRWAELAADSAARSASDEVRTQAATALAWVHVLRGLPIDDALVDLRDGPAGRFGALDPARAVGVRHAFRGEIEEARAAFRRLAESAEERGELYFAATIQFQQCEVELRAGHLQEAARLLDDFDDLTEGTDLRAESFIARLRALHAAEAGDHVAAVGDAMAILERPRSARDTGVWNRLEANRALGLSALLRRDAGQASAHLAEVWGHTRRERIDDPGAFPVAGDLVEALVQSDRVVEASEVVAELRRLSVDQEHPWGLAASKRGASLVRAARGEADVDAIAGELSEVAATYGDLGLDFDRARTLLSLGTIERRSKRRGAARSALEDAAATFERHGSYGWAERAREELGRVSGRRSAPDDRLTETELRVATLAADGLSNKEIASQLFVAVSTVEGHLSRAYAKLGVSSRGQLARQLREAAQE